MGLLAFAKKIDSIDNPYSDLLIESAWNDIQHSFTKDYCSVLGLSHESPLYIRYEYFLNLQIH